MKKKYKRSYSRPLILLIPCVLLWVVCDFLTGLESYSVLFGILAFLLAVTNVLWSLGTPYAVINGITIYVNENMITQRKMAIPDVASFAKTDAKTFSLTSRDGKKLKVKINGMRKAACASFEEEVNKRLAAHNAAAA
jgi:hypothetical protein